MANAVSPSIYEILTIGKNGREIGLEGRTTSFDYYESLLSPNVTATMTFVDTGDSISASQKTDRQQRLGTIYNSLPITGEEELRFKIRSKLGTLDFSREPLVVNSAVNLDQESQRESVLLSLVSKQGTENLNIPLSKKYDGRISDSVRRILKEEFKITDDKIDIEPTKLSYSFQGYTDSPFENIIDLASKSTPESGNPGFFFYQTQNKFNFKSIDGLISAPEKAVYFSSAVNKSSIEDDINDNKILSYSINKNQNLLNALKSGVYISRNIFFDPRTFKYKEIIYTLTDGKLEKSLGSDPYIPKDIKSYSRTHSHILDIGFHSEGIDTKANNNPEEYQAKATMRYNLLFSQVVSMMVPCNPNLKAGDTIRCEFEKITLSEKEQGSFDQNQSGKYLILNLCHHFDTKNSFTSLTLVRDSYGIYTNKNKG